MQKWHEQQSWWTATRHLIYGTDTWQSASEQVEHLLALTGLQPPLSVLDLPCGVGRHSLEFARRGYEVTGVDFAQSYLDEAQAKAATEALEIEFIQGDMREFSRPASFDLVVNLFTSFGFFEDQAEDALVLSNCYISLRDGGILVMDLQGKEVLARIFRKRDWRELEDGSLLLQERNVTQDWSWFSNRWIVIAPDGQRQEFDFSHRVYSASELKALVLQVGFSKVVVYGDLSGSPYDQTAHRLIVVARK